MSADLRDRLKEALSKDGSVSSDFDLNRDIVLPPHRKLTDAAVLVPIVAERQTVVLTKRSARLKHHPGQIAFPGGKRDATDATLADAALREAREEIGLPHDLAEMIGWLPPHETVTGYRVAPFVSFISPEFEPVAEVGEVSEVFEVPLAHVCDPERFQVQSRHWRGQRRYYYTVPYGPYYIWGATARILRGLADRMAA